MKVCIDCERPKVHARGRCRSCYDRWLKETNPGYRARQAANSSAWRRRNPEAVRTHRKRSNNQPGVSLAKTAWKYGLTVEEYVSVVAQPCGLCGEVEKPRYVDHDHATGRVRGALCHGCNLGVGFIEKRGLTWLRKAIRWTDGR